MIKTFAEYHSINEAKQVGTLYHVCDADKLVSILDHDSLGSPTSFSRNPMYDTVIGREKNYSFQIVIDGDKLSNNYKIRPVNDGDGWVSDEFEERVDKRIDSVGKYIKEIIVIKHYRGGETNKYDVSSYKKFIPYGKRWGEDLSERLFKYKSKYPRIDVKVKDYHWDLIAHVKNDDDFLKAVGLKNDLEEKLFSKVLGLWKSKSRILSSFEHKDLVRYIENNKKTLYTTDDEYDSFGNFAKNGEKISLHNYAERHRNDPYWDSVFAADPQQFLTDKNNNFIIIDTIRDENNTISVRILYGDGTKKSLSYYENLIKSVTSKKIVKINIEKSLREYYRAAA